MTPLAIEVLGWIASALVVLSLMMPGMVSLRIVSIVGSSIWIVYAVALWAPPLIATNVLIIAINCWHLARIWKSRKSPIEIDRAAAGDTVEAA